VRNRKAFALAMVLWISAILMASTIYLLGMYKKSVTNAQDLNDKLVAELNCDSYIDRLKFYALTGRYSQNYVQNDLEGFPSTLVLNNTFKNLDENVSIRLRSGGQMLSFYDSNILTLNHLIHFYTKDRLNYNDPYQDWLDLDSNSLLNGAENGYYFTFTKQYSCSNIGVIQHPEELFLIKNFKDIDEGVRSEIIKNFHFVNHSGLNVWMIKPKDIKKYIIISDFDLTQLSVLYQNDPIKYVYSLQVLLAKNGLDQASQSPSYVIDGDINVKYRNSRVKKQFSFYFQNSYKTPYLSYKNYLSTD